MISIRNNHKSPTFDEIIAQTSIIGALEKNKVAYVKLNTFVKDLDDKYIERSIKIDQEKQLNRQYIYNLDLELKLNSKRYKKKQELALKPKPLNDIHRKLNDKNLPELITNESPYVKQIKFSEIDNNNYFLPVLIQNLQRQQHYSHLNLRDLVDKNKVNTRSLNFKRQQKNRTLTSMDNASNYNTEGNASVLESVESLPLAVNKTVVEDVRNEITVKKRAVQRSATDEVVSKLKELKGKNKPKDGLEVIRSIRRDRMNPKEINEFYEAKMNLLRIAKRFDQYRSKCTKRCEFKNPSFLDLYGDNRIIKRDYDDDDDY
jgi:hypothetical protein